MDNIWAGALIFFLLIVYILDRLFTNNKYSPVRVFSIWWFCVILMSLFPVWGRKIASNETYMTILLAVLFFMVGCLSTNLLKKNKHTCTEYTPQGETYLNDAYINVRIITVVNIIVLLMIVVLFVRSFQIYGLQMFLNIGGARNDIYNGDTIVTSTIEEYLHSYLLRGTLFLDVVILPFLYFGGKKYKKMFVFSLVNILLYTFIYGGRMFVFYAGAILYFGMKIAGTLNEHYGTRKNASFILHFKKGNKKNRQLKILIVVLIVVIVLLTFSRNNSSHSNGLVYFIEKSITYFSTSPIYYELLQDITTVEEQAGFQFSFIGGLISFFAHFNSIVGFELFKDSVGEVCQHMTSNLVNAGGSVWTNAFPTMVYIFRFDFGLLGVAFNSFLFGAVAQYSYIKLRVRKSARAFLIYMIALYFIFESPMRWTGLQFWPYFVLFLIYLSTRPEKAGRYVKKLI